jgi:enamine deaminase RidA (YjgF/YER057c/UK114 family)
MSDIRRYDPDVKLSDMVEFGGRLYLAGQIARDTTANMKAQTGDVLAQIDALLARAGSDKSKLLSAVCYVADMRQKAQMDEAWLAWVDKTNPPARATVEARLGTAQELVEIQCIAAK